MILYVTNIVTSTYYDDIYHLGPIANIRESASRRENASESDLIRTDLRYIPTQGLLTHTILQKIH